MSSDRAAPTPLHDRQRALWLAAFLLYGVGDAATTMVGLGTLGVAEVGPIAGWSIAALGLAGFLLQKAVFFVASVGLWSVVGTPGRVAIPLAIVVVGGFVTGWNALVLWG